MIDYRSYYKESISENELAKAKCDKYDYMIAVFSGSVAGLVDSFFVKDPMSSILGKSVDKAFDKFTIKAAQHFWKKDPRSKGKPRKMPQTLEQCISYLEQAFPVNYDARYAKDLKVKNGELSGMRPLNHHLLSLAHSPDPIGLFFSIIDQFKGYATFIDNGKVIHVIPEKTSGAIPYMQGTNIPSMLFCGFINWLGHLISDLVGSSSTRREGKTGRGAGIPIPFYELFLLCDFGNFNGKKFSEVMIQVFEEGYDFRFGATMAIPVLLEELMIKVFWFIRQKFVRKKSLKASMPTMKHADLRVMLLVGNGTLCLIDAADAAKHGLIAGVGTGTGFNVVSFICHLNLIGWIRLTTLVLKELKIRFGPVIDKLIKTFIDDIMSTKLITPAERKRIEEFNQQIEAYQSHLDDLFNEFVLMIEEEYKELYLEIELTFDSNSSTQERTKHSVRLAEISGVDNDKIIRNYDELDDFFN